MKATPGQETEGLCHDSDRLAEHGKRQRRITGTDSVRRLLRWKNELLAYRSCLDQEIEAAESEIERRVNPATEATDRRPRRR